jgi:hypothetical protein
LLANPFEERCKVGDLGKEVQKLGANTRYTVYLMNSLFRALEQPGEEVLGMFFNERCDGLSAYLCICDPVCIADPRQAALNILGLPIPVARICAVED